MFDTDAVTGEVVAVTLGVAVGTVEVENLIAI